jgi:hypothetical protein
LRRTRGSNVSSNSGTYKDWMVFWRAGKIRFL